MEKPIVKEGVAQPIREIERLLSTERWLLDVGLVPDTVQENLIAYGFLSSEAAQDVDVILDVPGKSVTYEISLFKKDAKKYRKFRDKLAKYAGSKSLWGKWMLLRTMKKNIRLNIEENLQHFIKDYLPRFSIKVGIKEL